MHRSHRSAHTRSVLSTTARRRLALVLAFVMFLAILTTVPGSPALAAQSTDPVADACPMIGEPHDGDAPMLRDIGRSSNPKSADIHWQNAGNSSQTPGDIQGRSSEWGKIGYWIGQMVEQLWALHRNRGSEMLRLSASIAACFPEYNVLIANRHPDDVIELEGVLVAQNWRISGADQWLYIFKSGTYIKNGDLGARNWAWYGTYDRTSDREVHFTSPIVSYTDDWYTTGTDDYNETARCSINTPTAGLFTGMRPNDSRPSIPAPARNGMGDVDWEKAMQNAVAAAQLCWPDHNTVIVKDSGNTGWDMSDLKMSDGRPAYQKKIGLGDHPDPQRFSIDGYTLYVFDTGTARVLKDGGWVNWGYAGHVTQTANDGKDVTFAEVDEKEFNRSESWHTGSFTFSKPDNNYPPKPAPGDWRTPRCTALSVAESLKDAIRRLSTSECADQGYADEAILAVKHVENMRFIAPVNLRYRWESKDMSIVTMDAGIVVNTGDAGEDNWYSWGASGPVTTLESGNYVLHFPIDVSGTKPDDGDGEPTDPGDGGGTGEDPGVWGGSWTNGTSPIRVGDFCLDVPAGNAASGVQMQVWRCNGGGNQNWQRQDDGTVRNNGKCLDARGGGTVAAGTAVQLWDCHGGNAQQWSYNPDKKTLRHASGLCLDVEGGVRQGGKTILWTCHGGPNQQWSLSEHPNPDTGGGGNDGGNNGGGDNGGGSSPTPGGAIPNLTGTTFQINADGSSFTATQPKDSVATYIIENGKPQSVTISAADGSQWRHAMETFSVTSQGSPSATIKVDTAKRYQTIDGFGASMTSSAAYLIERSGKRDAIMRDLFGTGPGQAGMTIVRSPMGASDLQAPDDNFVYTYEDNRGSFSVTPNGGASRQIAIMRQAKGIVGGSFKLIGTPWTAPAWAKLSGKLTGGSCAFDRGASAAYAQYFNKYIEAYSAQGLRPWMVSMQNEPQNCKQTHPTTTMTSADQAALSKALKQVIPGDVRVLGWDHNWDDRAYVNQLVSQGNVDYIGYHCYAGENYNGQTTAKPTLMTECSGFVDQNANLAGNLGWEVAHLLIGPLRNGSTGSIYWSYAQDAQGKPYLSSPDACDSCRGMMTVNGDGSYTKSQDFYFFAQFSAFVRPGAVRVESNNAGNLSTVAFKDGNRTIVVVLNSDTRAGQGNNLETSNEDMRGKIVQWQNDGDEQNPAWVVGTDGLRRWISDIKTYQCLKDGAGIPDRGPQSATVLDRYANYDDVWAVCGAGLMGAGSELMRGTYMSSDGGGRLSLGKDGSLVASDANGNEVWRANAKGDSLIMQEDGNLVLRDGNGSVKWSTGTAGAGGHWVSIRDDGSFIVSTKQDKTVWINSIDTGRYVGKIVQWDGDGADQKTSWEVGFDGNRRVVNDWETFKCLHDAGAGNSNSVTSNTLDAFPDLNGVWATCGADRMGPNAVLSPGSYLASGEYRLLMQTNGDLVLRKGDSVAWSTKTNDGVKKYLKLNKTGQLALFTAEGRQAWTAGVGDRGGQWLVLGKDGGLNLYNGDGSRVWGTDSGTQNPDQLKGSMVQWDGDTAAQKTSWQVGLDGNRRVVHDLQTYRCLADAGAGNAKSVNSGTLDRMPDQNGVWATCGADRLGGNGILNPGSHLQNGPWKLKMELNGDLVLKWNAEIKWRSNTGDGDKKYLKLGSDNVLALWDAKGNRRWSANVGHLGGQWLVLGENGALNLYNGKGESVWSQNGPQAPSGSSMKGKMVQWDGDTASQRTSWEVGLDGRRRVVNDTNTYNCLKSAGAGDVKAVPKATLDQLPNTKDVWATCGADRLGRDAILSPGSHLQAGPYKLRMDVNGELILKWNNEVKWRSDTADGTKRYLKLGSDNVLALWDADGNRAWSAGVGHLGGEWLVLDKDKGLMLYDGKGNVVWSKK